jgi:hypothetical protein
MNQQHHFESLGDVLGREQNISRIPLIHLKFTANTIIGRECAVPNLIVLARWYLLQKI